VCETGLTRLDFGVEEVELQGKQHEQHPRVDSESDGSFSARLGEVKIADGWDRSWRSCSSDDFDGISMIVATGRMRSRTQWCAPHWARAVGYGDDSPMVETQHEPLRPLCIHTIESVQCDVWLVKNVGGTGRESCSLVRATIRRRVSAPSRAKQTLAPPCGVFVMGITKGLQVFLIPGSILCNTSPTDGHTAPRQRPQRRGTYVFGVCFGEAVGTPLSPLLVVAVSPFRANSPLLLPFLTSNPTPPPSIVASKSTHRAACSSLSPARDERAQVSQSYQNPTKDCAKSTFLKLAAALWH
jgi:hypothetical protein